MKKMININFQGRIIPIEETAYDLLKTYVDSLRKYFVNEEGRDEIINDIESRIAELFNDRLKRGSVCITDEDVNAVIASIGRPQDFEDQSGSTTNTETNTSTNQSQSNYQYATNTSRLVRNSDDKIIAGVCSGLANSMRVDPVIMRILFVLFFFLFGSTFLIYIILWILVPSQSIKTNVTKRLYRSMENKAIAGVCSGLASYFKTDIWVPRLIFSLPLFIGLFDILSWDNFFPAFGFISGSFGFPLVFTYIVLWIVLPEATTSAEKLEMRGERIDLNSIRNTVNEDLQSIKGRAQQFGEELKETVYNLGNKVETQQAAMPEAAPVVRNTSSGISNVIGIFLKIILFVIIGVVGIAVFGILIALFGVGIATMPFKGYLLEDNAQNVMAWSTLLLFLGIPILAFMVWIIRRIAGVKTKNHFLGYAFGALFLVGLFSCIGLIISLAKEFRSHSSTEQSVQLSNPQANKLVVKVSRSTNKYYGNWWNNKGFPFSFSGDSIYLPNVGLNISKSNDSSLHLLVERISQGRKEDQAQQYAESIGFGINQTDSTLYLDQALKIPRGQKFRNQQINVNLLVPVGKRILVDHSVVRKYDKFRIQFGPNDGRYWSDDERDFYHWDDDVEYIMTPDGLERITKLDEKELKIGRFKLKISDRNENNVEIENKDDNENESNEYRYRYHQIEDSFIKQKVQEKMRAEMNIKDSIEREKRLKEALRKNTTSVEDKNEDREDNSEKNWSALSPVNVLRNF